MMHYIVVTIKQNFKQKFLNLHSPCVLDEQQTRQKRENRFQGVKI